jgi:twitching motility two-component system response regulator PilG
MDANIKVKVMVVDDSQSMRGAAMAALKDSFEVMTCENGLDAIAALGGFRPDIIFVDIVMPKLDGYETVALIRMNEAFTDVPILMMSSKGGVFDVARGRLLGFSGSIVKPFRSEALLAAIAEHVGAAEVA